MNPRLLEHFHSLCQRALRATSDRDTDPVVHAFGYLVWLTALGESQVVPRASIAALRRLGHGALLALQSGGIGTAEEQEDRAHAGRSVGEVLRVGLSILDGSDAPLPEIPTTALHPASTTLARMLEGQADGLTAGRYAVHVLGCVRCQRLLQALPAMARDAEVHAPMQLAASPTPSVRAPENGRVVARLKNPEAEAVLFDDADARRLAIYSISTQPLRIVAAGVSTEDTRPGYWIGRIDSDIHKITGTLHYSTATESLTSRLHVNLDTKRSRAAKKKAPTPRKRTRR